MRVVVCCKGVPVDAELESIITVDGDIHYRDTDFYINEYDAYAVEAAIALKKLYGAETFSISLGPLRVQEVLHFSLARGIDQALRIDGESIRPEVVAWGLIPVLREIKPQFIIVGVQSEDWMGGELGIYLSQALDMSLAYAVTEISDLNETSVRVKKEIGDAKLAELVLTLPTVLCVQSGIYPLRYVSNVKKRKAAKHPIKLGGKLNKEDALKDISGMMAYEVKKVFLPSIVGRAEIFEGERSENAVKVLEVISKAI